MSNIDGIRISSLPDSREITDNDYVIIEQADGTRKANIQTINKKTNDTMVSLDKKIVDVTNSIKESNVSLDNTINKVSSIDTKVVETEKSITALSSQMEDNTQQIELKADKTYSDTEFAKRTTYDFVNNKVFSMANMGQDIKQAMTNGSVAVIGENTVLDVNIVDKQITHSKLSILKDDFNIWENGSVVTQKITTTGNWQMKQYEITSGFSVGDKFIFCIDSCENNKSVSYGAITGKNSANNNLNYKSIDATKKYVEFIVPNGTVKIVVIFQSASEIPIQANTIVIWRGVRLLKNSSSNNFKIDDSIDVPIECIIGQIPNSQLQFDINEYSKLVVGKNKFDKTKVTVGYYIDAGNGTLIKEDTNYPFSCSDYIEIISNTQYAISTADPLAFYDINKDYISGGRLGKTFTTPANSKYIRTSVPTSILNNYQLELGTPTSYEEFKYILPEKALPTHTHKKEDIIGLTSNGDTIELNLPKNIYVAIGYPLEIYNKHICSCGNIENFHFRWSLVSGKNMGRKLVINPSTSMSAKTELLTLNVYSNDLTLLASISSTVHYLKATNRLNPLTIKNILCIGDSLTDMSKWREILLQNLKGEIGNNFRYIGTVGSGEYKHEGYSGWSINSFLSDTSNAWTGDFKIKVSSDLGIITPKKQYKITNSFGEKIFEYEKTITDGTEIWIYLNRISGQGYLDDVGNFTEVTSSVSGSAIIQYTKYEPTSVNPFYNKSTNKFDSKYYSDNLGTVADYCIVWLGANGVSGDIDKNLNLISANDNVTNLKTIIDDILSKWINCKVLVCYNHYWAEQSGLGNASGTGYFDKGIELGVFNINKKIKEIFEEYNNRVILVPVGQTHDSKYNYPKKTVGVNSRNNTITEYEQIDRVHPDQLTGFVQFSDSIYGALINNI